MRKFTLLMAFLATTMLSFGADMSGTYTVGTGGTYATLGAAVTDLNAATITGNVVLEIVSDISEPANIGLGVDTKGFSITIRPNADAPRTITFTQLSDNSSPTGHFVIGYPTAGLSVAWSDANTIATNNVTIDGYAVGGSTRQLTFTNTNASHTNARVIVVVGACENTFIKNCIINNLTTHTGSPFCVGAVVRKGTAIEVAPKNLTIENNVLTALGNNVAMGARITNSGTIAAAKLTGLAFKNNIVTAKRRLFEINYTSGGEISGNTFETQATGVAGTVTYGLWTSSGVDGTINIFNNKFVKAFTEETGAFGHRVVSLASTATYNIYNNTFAGMDKTKASTAALNLTYLFYSGVAGKIFNNTFYMPALTDPSQTGGYYRAINLSGNTAEIKNNIFISDEAVHTNTSFIGSVPSLATDFNNFYLRQPHTGATVVSTYATLADYQTANPTKDKNSKSVDVLFTNAATGDLHLAGASVNDVNLAAPLQATVANDIDGTVRTAITYKGAHQPSDMTAVAKQFTVTVPNGTEKVYIAGDFTGKSWDNTDPLQLTAQTTANVFSGIFPCVDGVNYKYLCEKGDWDYQEASSLGSTAWNPTDKVKPTGGSNRTYNASDVVTYWVAQPGVKLNVSFAEGSPVPSKLFVKGSWDGWTTPIELTSGTNPKFSGMIGNGTTDLIYSNIAYKYYTTDEAVPNWEADADGNDISDRWSIYPSMNDVIARFKTQLSTGIDQPEMEINILRTPTGISVLFDGSANVELYSINGAMIDKTVAYGSYTRDLNPGAYIIRINGKATKFIR